MKKTIVFMLMGFIWINSIPLAQSVEVGMSYDYFRGIPDGSWNGNTGALVSANVGGQLYDCVGYQLGASYGNYNWDGRENLVFENSKSTQQIGMFTGGIFSSLKQYNLGIVYDHMISKHFGIYDQSPSINQLRLQAGYELCSNEFGIWGTVGLSESHKTALGVPLVFDAIDQVNLFWTHQFNDCSKSSVWIGAPYSNSLYNPHNTAGLFLLGFSVKTQLTPSLCLQGDGSYMKARRSSNSSQSYAANICIGLTYSFTSGCFKEIDPYMPLANHSNFLIDTNLNQ